MIVDRPDPKTGQLNLLPDYFFLVAGWKLDELDGPAALEHYRQRGTFEDRLGEFQQAIRPHLSHDDFQANEALLRLSLLAFNLASMLRIEYEAAAGSCFDLGRFQREVLKAGGRVVKGAAPLTAVRGARRSPFLDRADRLPPALETPPPLSPATRGAGPRLDAAAPSRLPARGTTLLAPAQRSAGTSPTRCRRLGERGRCAEFHRPDIIGSPAENREQRSNGRMNKSG